MTDIVPWLVWLFPFIGAGLVYPASRVCNCARNIVAVGFPLLSAVAAGLMLPNLLEGRFYDDRVLWIELAGFGRIDFGVLVDPLSILLATAVAIISFLIILYSAGYMRNEPGATRYWFFMNLFVGSMLLLVLTDNLLVFFIGWKLVGFCSFALIGHYYLDEEKYWIGGPKPYPFQKPSECANKALFTTSVGDVALLGAIILIYVYSGTFNFMELYHTAPEWMGEMARMPGMLALTAILFTAGPISKSAQFPFQEWLPEAMAGPAPVSALIHASTMVKAGVYLIARVFPIFYFGYWVAGCEEYGS